MYKYIRIILILIPICVLLFLFNKQYPLDGTLEIVYDFSKPNAFIDKLTPVGRVSNIEEKNGNFFQTINIDPVYFGIELLSQNYKEAIIKIKYKNIDQPIVGLGVLANKDIWSFDIKQVQNSIIDGLLNKWHQTRSGDTVLLQKEKKYDSLDSFLKNKPPINEIAVFNYSLPYKYEHQNYQLSNKYQTINHTLKGQHSFYTYLGEEEKMDFVFGMSDINKRKGIDTASIEVYQGSELVKKIEVYGDEIDDESEQKNNLDDVELKLDNIESGYYKINLTLPDDILINQIKTKQQLITFIDKLNFDNDESGSSIQLFSNSSFVRFATSNILALQKIEINNNELEINDVGVEFNKKIDEKLYEINIPKGGVVIQGAGLFSFSKEQFFNPTITILDEENKLEGINYVIANYNPPQINGEWVTGSASFELGKLYKENNKIKAMISAPNLDKNMGKIEVGEIKVILNGDPFFDKLLRYLKRRLK